MNKGEQTRQFILQKAAELFNRQGYDGTSMSDIMVATGLEKEGIYNHFKSKDDLAVQAYEYAVDLMRQAFAEAIQGKYHGGERLQAVIAVFQQIPRGLPLPGGCPVMNMAVQANDTHPQLRACARQTMDEWRDFLMRITQRGLEREQLRPDTDADALVTLIISTLEGAIVLSRLYDDTDYMDRAVAHLNHHVAALSL